VSSRVTRARARRSFALPVSEVNREQRSASEPANGDAASQRGPDDASAERSDPRAFRGERCSEPAWVTAGGGGRVDCKRRGCDRAASRPSRRRSPMDGAAPDVNQSVSRWQNLRRRPFKQFTSFIFRGSSGRSGCFIR